MKKDNPNYSGAYFYRSGGEILRRWQKTLAGENNWSNSFNLARENSKDQAYLSFLPETAKVATILFCPFDNCQNIENYKNYLRLNFKAESNVVRSEFADLRADYFHRYRYGSNR